MLYWECTHGSKVFFEYPPYGKLVRHYCRHHQGSLNGKKNFPVIVKKPRGLLGNQSPSCPICGKLFKNLNNLENHMENLKVIDIKHRIFFENQLSFEKKYNSFIQQNSGKSKLHEIPKFGKINIKKEKKID
ncbi:MAG: C2H2-type zinc finger protein [Promethearchaeota archaeon]